MTAPHSAVNAVRIDIDGTLTEQPLEVHDGTVLLALRRELRCHTVDCLSVMAMPGQGGHTLDAWVDDEGLYRSAPNIAAQTLLAILGGGQCAPIFGRVLLLGADESTGETASLSGGVAHALTELVATITRDASIAARIAHTVVQAEALGRL